MDDCCCAPPPPDLGGNNKKNDAYRHVLWAVLLVNAAMFAVEIGAGFAAGSASLQADALDFLGDTANYAISLLVVGMALRYRASAARQRVQRWRLSASGSSAPLFGTRYKELYLARSRWERWASRR